MSDIRDDIQFCNIKFNKSLSGGKSTLVVTLSRCPSEICLDRLDIKAEFDPNTGQITINWIYSDGAEIPFSCPHDWNWSAVISYKTLYTVEEKYS